MNHLKKAYEAVNDKNVSDKAKRLERLNAQAQPLTPLEMERP